MHAVLRSVSRFVSGAGALGRALAIGRRRTGFGSISRALANLCLVSARLSSISITVGTFSLRLIRHISITLTGKGVGSSFGLDRGVLASGRVSSSSSVRGSISSCCILCIGAACGGDRACPTEGGGKMLSDLILSDALLQSTYATLAASHVHVHGMQKNSTQYESRHS